jgi:hypothetical protein
LKKTKINPVFIRIETCDKCPSSLSQRTRTGDSFDVAWDYYCAFDPNKQPKLIQEYLCWNEKPNIPQWCPRRKK